MARAIAKALRNKAALQLLAEVGGEEDAEYRKMFGARGVVLRDGRYLIELPPRSWGLWPSREVFWESVRATHPRGVFDPVLDAIGDATEFLKARMLLARDFARHAGAREPLVDLSGTIPTVDAKILQRTGEYWICKRERLRGLLAYVGQVLHERTGGDWQVGSGGTLEFATRDGAVLPLGTTLMNHADEAPRGGFSIADVVEELIGEAKGDRGLLLPIGKRRP